MMNASSSSSFIFSIILEQHVESDDILVDNDIPTYLVSKFHFVDLASSQSVREKENQACSKVYKLISI